MASLPPSRIYPQSMNSYNGQALVIGDNDARVDVMASLISYRDGLHTSWGGTLTPA